MMKYFPYSNFFFLASLWVLIFSSMSIYAVYSQDYHSPLSLTITFDQWPEESSWDIKIGDSTVMHFADYSDLGDDSDEKTVFINNINLVPARGYYFNFYDAFIDGICCIQGSGSYLLKDANGAVIKSGGEFEVKDSVLFDIAGDFCSNKLKDNGEVGIDCGGEFCAPCLEYTCPEDEYSTLEEITRDMSVTVNRSIQSIHKVNSNLFVWFKAGEEIILDAGFEISNNSIFIAEIGGCLKER